MVLSFMNSVENIVRRGVEFMEDLKVLFSNDQEISLQPDSTYAEELQLQEAIEASLIDLQASEIAFTESQIQEEPESSQGFCGICLEEKDSNEIFKCRSCSHCFCSDCTCKFVQTKIQDSIKNITCPGLNCTRTIDPALFRPFIPAKVMAKWEMGLIEAAVLDSEKFYCPYKDCSAMLVNDNDGGEVIREAECPVCRRLFCAQCRVSWHQGVDCEEFQKLDENDRAREDLMVHKLAKDHKWMRCPHCNFLVEKSEGCLHMTCRCKFEFCYICGSKWSEDHWNCQRS